MDRRKFIGNIGLASSLTLLSVKAQAKPASKNDKLNVAFIGVGARGMGQLRIALKRKDIEIIALCDIDSKNLNNACEMVKTAKQKTPQLFGKGENDYKNLLQIKDLDAVIVSTPWLWHTQMAIDSMNANVPVGLEVSGAFNLQECWDLVEAYEKTKTPFFVLENVAYRRDIMAVLNMVRQNMFGEIIHLEGGYQHDLREVKFNNGKQLYGGGVEFGEKAYSEAKWRTDNSVHRNGDLYPTHGLGPVANMINNNRGNRFLYLTSIASKARGLHNYVVEHPEGGKNHPNASVEFKLGDVVTTNIKCANGESILLSHDTNLPRPYSLGFRVQGTKGIWMDVNNGIHIDKVSKPHEWDIASDLLKKYDHPLWKKYESESEGAGHGGMDFFVLHGFFEALKNNEAMPMDVYDFVSWAAVTCLSEQSVEQGSAPVYFPDFTRGKWMIRKPIFGFDDRF